MYENLRKKVDNLFENAPKTPRANELKEEILANLIDKYNDLIASGKEEEEALNSAIAGIGEVDELIRGLKENDVFNYEQMKKERKKSALIISVSVGMYIMSMVIYELISGVFGGNEAVAACVMLTIVAVATCLIIYNSISRTKYIKEDNTMVEEFKEWKSANNEKQNILKSIKSTVWTCAIALFFIIGFVFDGWGYAWIIFIIGIAVQKIITLTFDLKE